MNQPPINRLGQEYPQDVWAKIVSDLRADPSPDNIKRFDRALGPGGYSAEKILGRLNRSPGPTVEETKQRLMLPY
jgi:hypothetical protein